MSSNNKMSKEMDSTSIYMRDIQKTDLISKQRERELSDLIHGDDEELSNKAKDELITSNLRLVVKIAHDFKNKGLSLNDLIAEGNLGLMRASELFDYNKGAKFSTYSAWWIKQKMNRALADQSKTIRVPVEQGRKWYKITKAIGELTREFEREPSNLELSEYLDMSIKTIESLKYATTENATSLSNPIKDGEDGELIDLIENKKVILPGEELQKSEDLEFILKLSKTELTDRERLILILRNGLFNTNPETLENIGQRLRISGEMVRLLEISSYKKIREAYFNSNIQKTNNSPIIPNFNYKQFNPFKDDHLIFYLQNKNVQSLGRNRLRSKIPSFYNFLRNKNKIDFFYPSKTTGKYDIGYLKYYKKHSELHDLSRTELFFKVPTLWKGLKNSGDLDTLIENKNDTPYGSNDEEKIRYYKEHSKLHELNRTQLSKQYKPIFKALKKQNLLDELNPLKCKNLVKKKENEQNYGVNDNERVEYYETHSELHNLKRTELSEKYLVVYNALKNKKLLDKYIPFTGKTSLKKQKWIDYYQNHSELHGLTRKQIYRKNNIFFRFAKKVKVLDDILKGRYDYDLVKV